MKNKFLSNHNSLDSVAPLHSISRPCLESICNCNIRSLDKNKLTKMKIYCFSSSNKPCLESVSLNFTLLSKFGYKTDPHGGLGCYWYFLSIKSHLTAAWRSHIVLYKYHTSSLIKSNLKSPNIKNAQFSLNPHNLLNYCSKDAE